MLLKRFHRFAGMAGIPTLRCAVLTLLVAALLASPASKATAGSFGDLDVSGLQAVSSGKLADMRGGFSFGGMDISFGVIMRTAVGGMTILETAFYLEHPSDVTETFTPGDSGLTLSQTQQAFALNKTGLNIIHQMGNAGGGIVASVANALNNQIIQQSVTMNVGIQNMSTIAGLSTIGTMLNNLGVATAGF